MSPRAELERTANGTVECRQAPPDSAGVPQCPRVFAAGVWWPRTPHGHLANVSRPSGALGFAFRLCLAAASPSEPTTAAFVDESGWTRADLIELDACQSRKLVDTQLVKWARTLAEADGNGERLLNSDQAIQFAEDLERITRRAQLDYEFRPSRSEPEEDDLAEDEPTFDRQRAREGPEYTADSLFMQDLVVIKVSLDKYITACIFSMCRNNYLCINAFFVTRTIIL